MITDQDYWDEQQKLIESQAAEIAELDALRNDAVLRLDTYKALCDQMGNALEYYQQGIEMLDAVAKVASDAENLVISQKDEIAALTAKLEAAEQDAARYRFWKYWWMNSENKISQLPGAVLEHLRDTGLDASFDAAIASTKPDSCWRLPQYPLRSTCLSELAQ